MKSPKFPAVSQELLEELSKRFPSACPPPHFPGDQIAEMYRIQGTQKIIDFLRTEFNRQNKTILEATDVHVIP